MSYSPQDRASNTRIVSWNIRQGGGSRAATLATQIDALAPDVCLLLEYCNTPASRRLREHLRQSGLTVQIETVGTDAPGNLYGMLIAARHPLEVIDQRIEVADVRWRLVRVAARLPLTIGCVHVPNRGEGGADKYACLDSIVELARCWDIGPGLILGDYNTGLPGIDEEAPYFNRREERFMNEMCDAGWTDAFRYFHPDARRFSWWSIRQGRRTGFLLDHAFASPDCLPFLASCTLAHEPPSWPSDHAALIVDLHV